MRLKLRAIQVLVAGLEPMEMAAIHLMGLGGEMHENITKTDLTNIIWFLCKQLDWIEWDDQVPSHSTSRAHDFNDLPLPIYDGPKDIPNVGGTSEAKGSDVRGSENKDDPLDGDVRVKVELNPDMFYGNDSDVKQEVDYYEPSVDQEDAKTDVKLEGTEHANAKTNPENLPLKLPLMKSQDKPFKCSHCDKSFMRRAKLIIHERVHTGEKTEDLDDDTKDGSVIKPKGKGGRPKLLKGPKNLSCETCGKKFTFAHNLKKHYRIHTGEKPYGCTQCERKFTSAAALLSHEMNHRGERPHCCSTCGKTFTLLTHLKQHEITHTGVKPHTCSYCGKGFTTSGSLKMHILLHTGEKPFSCDLCDYKCLKATDLKFHERTNHTGEKPFCCMFCGKAFCRKGDLKSHERVHTGDKPFSCSQCDYKCSRASDLKKHERTHNAEKAFGCSFCDYRCNDKGNLQAHMNIHNGLKPFKCQLGCTDVAYANRGNLAAHVRSVHKGIKRNYSSRNS